MIQPEQYRPSAAPVSTVGAPAPTFSKPMPVQAPRAAMPSMAPLPVAPTQTDNSFINALNNFGSGLGRLGNALQEQYRVDLASETAHATAEYTALSTTDAISKAERVQMENKSKAQVAGSMTSLGLILGHRFQTEALQAQAAGEITAEGAPDFLRTRAKGYLDKFKSDDFAKAFSPTAEATITQFNNQKLTAEAKEHTDQFTQIMLAEGAEGRAAILHLPPEQQTAAIQTWLDKRVEKAGKDGTLTKAEVNGVYKTLADIAADQGDLLFLKAIGDKPRGDAPPLSKGNKDWQGLLDRAAKENDKRTKVHSIETTQRLELAKMEGRLGSDPLFKQGPQALIAAGYSEDEVKGYLNAHAESQVDRAFELHPVDRQRAEDAVQRGDLNKVPSLFNPRDMAIFGRKRIIDYTAAATKKNADRFEMSKTVAIQADTDKQTTGFAQAIAMADPTAWTTLQDKEITGPDGVKRTVKASSIAEEGMAIAFAAIDRQLPGQPALSLNQKVAKMAQTNFVPKSIADLIKNGAVAASATAIGQQDPATLATGMAAQTGGLTAYRAFDSGGAMDVLRHAVGQPALDFYAAVDATSQYHTGGNDLQAIKDVSAAWNRKKTDEETKATKERLDLYITQFKGNVVNTVNANSVAGRGDSHLANSNLLTGIAEDAIANLVRGGMDPHAATLDAGKQMARYYGNYRGLLVRKDGNQDYTKVDDFLGKLVVAANPHAGYSADDIALVPSLATSAMGRANAFVLKATADSADVGHMDPLVIQTRAGPYTINDPTHITMEQIVKLQEAMQLGVETKAAAERATIKYDLGKLSGSDQGNLGRAAAGAYHTAIAAGKTEDEARSAGRKFLLDRTNGVDQKAITAATDLLTWGIKQPK